MKKIFHDGIHHYCDDDDVPACLFKIKFSQRFQAGAKRVYN